MFHVLMVCGHSGMNGGNCVEREEMIRDEAEALAIAMKYGFADVADAVHWADTIISTEQQPHSTICDVALAVGKRTGEVIDLLAKIPGVPDHNVILDLLIQLVQHRLAFAPPNADSIAKRLYYM